MGTLKITGTIDLGQFQPEWKSDADTIKLHINPNENPIAYSTAGNKAFKPTKVFYNSYVGAKKKDGSYSVPTKKSVKPLKRDNTQINIRLQGIDAPELHYKIYGPKEIGSVKKKYEKKYPTKYKAFQKINKHEYRQWHSKAAVLNLYHFLRWAADGKNEIRAEFISENINKPSDIIDVFGRFVGDVIVKVGAKKVNVNHWVVGNGYAFPAFYNSMKQSEMNSIQRLTRVAEKAGLGFWKNYTPATLLRFDFSLTKDDSRNTAQKDKGKVNFPKVYRRLAVFNILKKSACLETIDFMHYLEEKNDKVKVTGNTKIKKFADCFTKKYDLKFHPEKIIFTEKESQLVDAKGKPVTKW